ncbi:SDR family oxidoreductase [Homoserinibacter gongjuensis]|uniref:NAD(P)-binding domain-containing protein n=1 Tax=Homoserinibacter gongjuensis TaxID=1162968 RepID=A0ABQ6JT24_9MICO|nr:NAD(P)H-binding protein [Homoserinibacter gongjuensis]GMA91437.1 hypothetical protein GCM10025869_19660 [Homoserinibacter gongjuensis]
MAERTAAGKILVVGATGLVGRQLVSRLESAGHEVVPASPSAGVDAATGAGLADAFAGVEVVIDVSKPHSYGDEAVLRYYRQSTTQLLRAGADAGVRHHVTLAAIGTDRLTDSAFYRAKRVQEQLVEASAIPFTLVRSSQFFEFALGIADASTVEEWCGCRRRPCSRWRRARSRMPWPASRWRPRVVAWSSSRARSASLSTASCARCSRPVATRAPW